MGHAPSPERKNKIKLYSKNKKVKRIGSDPKNSGPNPRSFRFLVGGTLGSRHVGPDDILAICLAMAQAKVSVLPFLALRKCSGSAYLPGMDGSASMHFPLNLSPGN